MFDKWWSAIMSTKTLQSQIQALLKGKNTLTRRNSQATVDDHAALIASLEEGISSALQELNQVRAEMQAEQQSYQNLFKVAQEGYFVTDLEGTIHEANAISGVLL